MRDKMLDFIEAHRKFTLVSLVVIIVIAFVFMLKACGGVSVTDVVPTPTIVVDPNSSLIQDVEVTKAPVSQYQSSLVPDKDDDGRVVVLDPTKTPTPTPTPQLEPTYTTQVTIFDWTSVPKRNMDGSSCKKYQEGVKLADFGTQWGTELTEDDFYGGDLYLIGVEQNPEDTIKGNLQSVGWLIRNKDIFQEHDAIKFTNLHVIGSLSETHVALLCSYDWYSAHGLKETLVVFEDISGTLKNEDFKDGDIFSATIYAHNFKVVEDVNGQTVVVVQYNTFK